MTKKALFYAVLANLLGGSAYVAMAYALQEISVRNAVFLRTFLGVLFFFPFLIAGLRRLDLNRDDWLRLLAVGIFGYAAPVLIGTKGQDLSSATNASLLVCIEPISIILLSALWLKEKLSGIKIFAIVSGILGAGLIALQGIPFWGVRLTPHLTGDLLLFLHGFLWSLYTIIGKPVLRKVDPMSFTAITTALGLIPITLAALPTLPALAAASLSPSTIASVIYLGFGVTFLGTLAWNKAMELTPASRLANFLLLQPLIGVFLGVFLKKEAFSLWSALGGGLILLGLYAAARPERPTLQSSAN